MGNQATSVSSETSSFLSDEEKNRLDLTLERLERNVRITYRSHFTSSEYHGKVAKGLEILVTALFPTSTAGLMLSARSAKQAHLAVAGVSILGIIFSGLQKYESNHGKYHPAIKQESHFKAGIELSAFHSELIAFRQMRLRDPTLTREKFMEEYTAVIEKKRRCDAIIQTETWAYIKDRTKDKNLSQLWNKSDNDGKATTNENKK